MKHRLIILAIILVPLQCLAQNLIINEVCYSNKNILYDKDEDTPDWFELYNQGSHHVDLADFEITDDTSKSRYWQFPEVRLEPGTYIVVFASGKDIKKKEQMHTDFKLGNMRESLFLIDSDGNIADEVKPVCIPTNHTIARFPDGTGNLVVMKPSPGITNDNSEVVAVDYQIDELRIDYPGGMYDSPISVSLANKYPGNVIMYTLDGDLPDEESLIYENPIRMEDISREANRFANKAEDGIIPGREIFKGNILRAVVYSNGCPASNEISGTYFINKDVKSRYKVPVVSLITEKDNLFDDETGIYVRGHYDNYNQRGGNWERDVHVEIFDQEGKLIIDQDAGLRIQGRRSRELPQKSFRLYAESEYGEEYFEYPFFGQKPELTRFKTLILRATNGTHGSLIKNELCNSIVQDMNIDYLAGETVVTFINGEYWGIYNLSERNDKHYIENNYCIEDPDLDIIGYEWDITVEEGDNNEYNRLTDFVRMADPASPEFYERISEEIDLDGLIDYYSAQLYFANSDWPKKNLELWRIRSEESKWRYFFFDPDAAMVWLNYDQIEDHLKKIESYQIYPEFSTLLFSTLLRNEDFKKGFQTAFLNHLKTTFNPDTVIRLINRFEEVYSPLVPEHIYRWRFPVSNPEWNKNLDRLRNFAVLRPMIIAEQLHESFGNPFIIYPNPGKGIFTVTFSGSVTTVFLELFSVSGAKLLEFPVLPGQERTFYFEADFPPGFYIVKITADGISYSGKLIIQ